MFPLIHFNLWGKRCFRSKADLTTRADPQELGGRKSVCTDNWERKKWSQYSTSHAENSTAQRAVRHFQRGIPVFWVIWRLVIICLHLGSITSLFLFCFRHCSIFFESASGQKRYKEKSPNFTTNTWNSRSSQRAEPHTRAGGAHSSLLPSPSPTSQSRATVNWPWAWIQISVLTEQALSRTVLTSF